MKHVLLTGATGGIGQAIASAIALHFPETRITLWGKKNKEVLNQLLQNLNCSKQAERVAGELLDLSSLTEVREGFKRAEQKFGSVDTVIFNAGIAQRSLLQDMTEAEIFEQVQVNLLSAIWLAKTTIPSLLQAENAQLILISSMWGEIGAAMESVYAASKGGLIAFGKSLAKELGYSDVRVNIITPGVIATPMIADYSAEDLESLRQETPVGRLGNPEDVAELVSFLLSERANFITGQVIGCNGGFVI